MIKQFKELTINGIEIKISPADWAGQLFNLNPIEHFGIDFTCNKDKLWNFVKLVFFYITVEWCLYIV